ncbi:hypothetical protein G3N55_05015 [Dissulfurirhabdus thermomarina]|uniref:HEAT repeat domain-containing protein n=1 Tax=Dissulfurirhabdus thermomarina TaxID=1765737 RepID=A0A6N9TUM5_DISTH|nr:hypothetical protein [Dissulfurirhabdus thermomarina]NDY42206.1 hypothetical protein [Dissulfurirhabdus thermomarina]NMX22666.1 hypothetical protein [Dissulfurirhabdus thermomarina]
MGERRKSWREIDKMRDRGGGRGRRRDDRSALERALYDRKLRDQYLKEAERLFQGPKGRPEHGRDLQAVHEAYGTPKFQAAARHYLETYGLPDEWGTLLLFLDLEGAADVVAQAIEALCSLAPEKGPVERKGLEGKLRVLAMTSPEPEVQEAAEAALEDLG